MAPPCLQCFPEVLRRNNIGFLNQLQDLTASPLSILNPYLLFLQHIYTISPPTYKSPIMRYQQNRARAPLQEPLQSLNAINSHKIGPLIKNPYIISSEEKLTEYNPNRFPSA